MAECNRAVPTTQRGDSESIVRRLSRGGGREGEEGKKREKRKNGKKRAVQEMFRIAVEGFSEISDFMRLNVSERLRDFNRSLTGKKLKRFLVLPFLASREESLLFR